MYAIIRTGGKQYRVEPGDVVRLERLAAEIGASVTLDDVLLVGGQDDVQVGAPRLENAAVVGTVVEWPVAAPDVAVETKTIYTVLYEEERVPACILKLTAMAIYEHLVEFGN